MENITVENISEYLMISKDDADKFYEWVLEETNWSMYDSIETWVHLKTKNLVSIYHVYELYKQYQEKENLSLIKNTVS